MQTKEPILTKNRAIIGLIILILMFLNFLQYFTNSLDEETAVKLALSEQKVNSLKKSNEILKSDKAKNNNKISVLKSENVTLKKENVLISMQKDATIKNYASLREKQKSYTNTQNVQFLATELNDSTGIKSVENGTEMTEPFTSKVVNRIIDSKECAEVQYQTEKELHKTQSIVSNLESQVKLFEDNQAKSNEIEANALEMYQAEKNNTEALKKQLTRKSNGNTLLKIALAVSAGLNVYQIIKK